MDFPNRHFRGSKKVFNFANLVQNSRNFHPAKISYLNETTLSTHISSLTLVNTYVIHLLLRLFNLSITEMNQIMHRILHSPVKMVYPHLPPATSLFQGLPWSGGVPLLGSTISNIRDYLLYGQFPFSNPLKNDISVSITVFVSEIR